MSSSYSDDTSGDDYSEYDTDRPVFSDPVSDSPSEDDSDISEQESAKDGFDLNSVSFCSTHKPGKMVRTCKSCSVALKIISDSRIVSKLFDEPSASGLKSRYGGRCDDVIPTMSLSDEVLDTVLDILSKGQFKGGRTTFADITRKYLVLPPHQHKKLTDDLMNEEVFNKLKRDKRFRNIFRFQGEIRDCLKYFRLSERPVFSIMDMLNTKLSATRKFGESIGLIYPLIPPSRSGVNVPRDSSSRISSDNLKFDSKTGIFPVPDITGLFDFLQLDRREEDEVMQFLENYRSSIGEKVLDFYKSMSDTLNDIEDLLIFHFDLWSHCDASMKELLRAKLASLFKGDIKEAILCSVKSDKEGGLFGGTLDIIFYLKLKVTFRRKEDSISSVRSN